MGNNPTQPTVKIILDKERRLLFDFNALAQMEKVTGKSFLSGELWDNLSATDVRALVWAGLLDEDPEITLEEVGKMLHMGNAMKMLEAVKEAWDLSMTGEASKEESPLTESQSPSDG